MNWFGEHEMLWRSQQNQSWVPDDVIIRRKEVVTTRSSGAHEIIENKSFSSEHKFVQSKINGGGGGGGGHAFKVRQNSPNVPFVHQ